MGDARNLIRKRKSFLRVNAMSVAVLIRDIQEETYSQQELADRCGLTIQTVRLYLKHLHKAGAIRITDWREDKRGTRTLRIFGFGHEKDAPKPTKKPSNQACRDYRKRQKMMLITNALTLKAA